ncbi:MAG: ABC transporter permease [Ruminococcus sp.]|nr:FtsX-like permease family protein [Ruminococcus sp.]MDD5889041.1 ABC transporter permease [Ruminococcus sp.]
MKSLLIRIKQSPLLSALLIFGLVTSILLISLGTSFVSNLYYSDKAKNQYNPKKAKVYDITYSALKSSDSSVMNKLFSKVDNDTGLFINDLLLHTNASEVNVYNKVSGEYFTNNNVWHYPLISGSYYTAEDVKKGNKVVVLGSKLLKEAYERNGNKYIEIEEEEYLIKGVIGIPDEKSSWDNRIIMPCTSMPKNYFENNLQRDLEDISFVIYNEKGEYSQDIKQINAEGKKFFDNFSLDYLGELQDDNSLKVVVENPDFLLFVALIGYIITIIFAINITVFWIEKRKYEISVRKAFGFTNGSIMKMIFKEMIGFAIISFAIAIIVQFLLGLAVGSIANYTLKLYLPNLVIGLVVVLVTSLVTTLIPAIKAIKVEPAEALKSKEG